MIAAAVDGLVANLEAFIHAPQRNLNNGVKQHD